MFKILCGALASRQKYLVGRNTSKKGILICNQLASIGVVIVVHKGVNPGLTEVFMIGVSHQQAVSTT